MTELIDKPEVFLNHIHPKGSKGLVVFAHKNTSKMVRAKVPVNNLSKIVQVATGLNNIFFSTSSYLGLSIILNFYESRALFVKLDVRGKHYNEYSDEIYKLVSEKDLPIPNAILTDGEICTVFWLLSESIGRSEIYKLCIYQKILHELFIGLNALNETRNITSLIRSVGSLNPNCGLYSRIIHFKPDTISRERMETKLLKNITADKPKNLEYHGALLLDIQSVWHYRSLEFPLRPDLYNDWIIFHGAELSHLCNPEQLFIELRAIAESLEGQSWKKISHKHNNLISKICETAHRGYIEINGTHFSTTGDMWRKFIEKRLDIQDTDVEALGLNILLSKNNMMTPRIRNIPNALDSTYGFDNSVEIDVLIKRSIAIIH